MSNIIKIGGFLLKRFAGIHFRSNMYLLVDRNSGESLLIDAGGDNTLEICTFIEESCGRLPEWIIITHEHFDHVAGLEEMRNAFHAKVAATETCSAALANARRNLSVFLDGSGFKCAPAEWICERNGWSLPWAGHKVTMISTPGHSPGGLCVAIHGVGLFGGDTLLINDRIGAKFRDGDPKALSASFRALDSLIDADAWIYPGHGDPFRFVLHPACSHNVNA